MALLPDQTEALRVPPSGTGSSCSAAEKPTTRTDDERDDPRVVLTDRIDDHFRRRHAERRIGDRRPSDAAPTCRRTHRQPDDLRPRRAAGASRAAENLTAFTDTPRVAAIDVAHEGRLERAHRPKSGSTSRTTSDHDEMSFRCASTTTHTSGSGRRAGRGRSDERRRGRTARTRPVPETTSATPSGNRPPDAALEPVNASAANRVGGARRRDGPGRSRTS